MFNDKCNKCNEINKDDEVNIFSRHHHNKYSKNNNYDNKRKSCKSESKSNSCIYCSESSKYNDESYKSYKTCCSINTCEKKKAKLICKRDCKKCIDKKLLIKESKIPCVIMKRIPIRVRIPVKRSPVRQLRPIISAPLADPAPIRRPAPLRQDPIVNREIITTKHIVKPIEYIKIRKEITPYVVVHKDCEKKCCKDYIKHEYCEDKSRYSNAYSKSMSCDPSLSKSCVMSSLSSQS